MMQVSERFRQSMGWLHTWLGIAFSAVLLAVFWTGTLTVFDREIDQWMKPELRFKPIKKVSLDSTVLPLLSSLDVKAGTAIWIGIPRQRIPAVRLIYTDQQDEEKEIWLHPFSGEVLGLTDSHAGSEFLFHFHFMLHMPGIIGYFIVAIAALAMMALIVSGIFIHRKLIQEFFTLRWRKKARRVSLDVHNLTGVIALPFHFIMPFSGLVILASTYFPWSMALPYQGDLKQLQAELSAYENPMIEPAGIPGARIDSLDDYVSTANNRWRKAEGEGASEADWVAVFNHHDANAYVVVERYFANNRVALGPDQMVFDIATGELIDTFKPLPVHAASNWLEGLHWIQFDHWLLRWLYFLGGLSGCAMIASGLMFWLKSRIHKSRPDSISVRVVRAISVTSMSGIIIATLAFFIANRILPKQIHTDTLHRHDLEIASFFAVWLLAFVHAVIRNKSAWHEQCYVIFCAAVAAVLLNWITTGDHLIAAIQREVWVIACMDVLLILGAGVALSCAQHLNKKQKTMLSLLSQVRA